MRLQMRLQMRPKVHPHQPCLLSGHLNKSKTANQVLALQANRQQRDRGQSDLFHPQTEHLLFACLLVHAIPAIDACPILARFSVNLLLFLLSRTRRIYSDQTG